MADNIATSMDVELLGTSNVWSPEGFSMPLMGNLYICKNNSLYIFDSER